MIILSIISLLISLLMQGLMSNFFHYSISNLSIFTTIYVLVNLIVLQQYFESDKKLFLLTIIFGMCFDIVYSNTFILCACIFAFIVYLTKIFSSIFPYNILTINIFSVLGVIIYHIITYLFLIILRFDSYSVLTLLKIIASSIIMTVIYTSILYFIINFIVKKFDLKPVKDK